MNNICLNFPPAKSSSEKKGFWNFSKLEVCMFFVQCDSEVPEKLLESLENFTINLQKQKFWQRRHWKAYERIRRETRPFDSTWKKTN